MKSSVILYIRRDQTNIYFSYIEPKRREILKNNRQAIIYAVDYCIENNILRDFLIVHRAEVFDMLLTEYDEKLHVETLKREGYDEGLKEGLKKKERYTLLVERLLNSGRIDDVKKIAKDEILQNKLMKEFGI